MNRGILMATIGSGGLFRRTAAITLALLATLAFAAPTLAKPGGNAAASAACENDGYLDWTDVDGNAFRNAGACVRYAAHGGTLVPVVVDPVDPFSISYAPSGTNGFVATLTGTGLEPDSTVDLVFTWGDTTRFLGDVADGNGEITFAAGGICISAGSPLTAVGATGTPAGEEFTEYSLPLPDASICPPA
jgi:hypothetical protein